MIFTDLHIQTFIFISGESAFVEHFWCDHHHGVITTMMFSPRDVINMPMRLPRGFHPHTDATTTITMSSLVHHCDGTNRMMSKQR